MAFNFFPIPLNRIWIVIFVVVAQPAICGATTMPDRFELREEMLQYRDVTELLYNFTVFDNRHAVYRDLAKFVDKFGNRAPGSESLVLATEYLRDHIASMFGMTTYDRDGALMKTVNFPGRGMYKIRVYNESVQYSPWKRNEESASVVHPRLQKLHILGLGKSVPTPEAGITAPILVVRSRQELRRLGHLARGRIVVFNQEYGGYHSTVWYRVHGPSEASRYGAVGVLVRSITPSSLQTPHTGAVNYAEDAAKIPAAAITIEDARYLQRLQDSAVTANVTLRMSCQTLDSAQTKNLIVEFGPESSDEIVLLGGHIDSWDVGQGAMDNAAGVFVSLHAFRNIFGLGRSDIMSAYCRKHGAQFCKEAQYKSIHDRLLPRRKIRLVIWTAEEIGLHGGRVHFNSLKENLGKVNVAMEIDSGAFRPTGLRFAGEPHSAMVMEEMGRLFVWGAQNITVRHSGGGDTVFFRKAGVPVAMLTFSEEDYERYFRHHHTEADTLEALDGDELDLCTLTWSAMAAILANRRDILV